MISWPFVEPLRGQGQVRVFVVNWPRKDRPGMGENIYMSIV